MQASRGAAVADVPGASGGGRSGPVGCCCFDPHAFASLLYAQAGAALQALGVRLKHGLVALSVLPLLSSLSMQLPSRW